MNSPQRDHNVRTLKAIVLCLIVAFIWQRVVAPPPKPPERAQEVAQQQTPLSVTRAPATNSTPSKVALSPQPSIPTVAKQKVEHPSLADYQSAGVVEVETNDYILRITKLGGRLISFKLKGYKLHHGEETALDMVENPDKALTPLAVYVGSISDDHVVYKLESVGGSLNESGADRYAIADKASGVLNFVGTLENGTQIRKRIELTDGAHIISLGVELSKPTADGQPVWAEWSHYFPANAENPRLAITHLMVLDGFNKLKHVALTEIPEGIRDYGTSQWVAIGDLYFMATLIPTVQGRNTIIGREGDVLFSRIAGNSSGGVFKFYVGPKDYRNLAEVGYGLERSIDLGWFTFLAYPLLWTIHYLYLFLGNYGLAIIALTLIVKALLLPLTKAGLESMKKMQDIQPEMKALRERIKDPTQLNQEIFALYKRKGVNPMGGCFPILIQIPVFLGLYNALLNSIELRHAPFALWITDLSAPEKLYILGVPVPVMVLLMAFSMVVQQWTSPPPSDPAQAQAMKIMPIIFALMFIIFPMPAGLVLYWLVSNLISIIQQVYLRKEGTSNSAYQATLIASIVIFSLGYVLTLI